MNLRELSISFNKQLSLSYIDILIEFFLDQQNVALGNISELTCVFAAPPIARSLDVSDTAHLEQKSIIRDN